ADAVQATGGVVGAGAELAAGVQLGEDDLDAGQTGPGLDVDRDPGAVVGHRDAAVLAEGDRALVAGPGQGLVAGVVDDLPDAVHQAAGVGGPDVHGGSFADRLEALEHQQMAGLVVAAFRCRLTDRGFCGTWHAVSLPADYDGSVEAAPVSGEALGEGISGYCLGSS